MSFRQFEKGLQQQIGAVLIVALVGVSGYLIGSQSSAANKATATEDPTEQTQPAVNANTNASVIDQLQASLEQPDATTAPHAPTASAAEPTASAANSATSIVNINTASLKELETLPGIGPKYAQAIIDYRLQHGPFVRLEDIQQVKGIGPKTFEKMKPLMTL